MTNNTDLNNALRRFEDTLDLYFVQKAPALPTNIKELLVSFAPILTIIGVVFSVLGILTSMGIGAIVFPFAATSGVQTGFGLGMAFLIAITVLSALAIPGLKAKTRAGWNFIFYATLLSLVFNLLNRDLIGFILGALIGGYILFQVRSYYK